MSYGAFLLSTPFFWANLCGLGVGAALSALTRLPRRARDAERARARKGVAVPLRFALAVAAIVGGFLVAESGSMLDLRLLPVAGVAAAGAFLFLRFPRIAGIPIVLAVAIAAVFAVLFIEPFVPVRGPTELGVLRVLSIDEGIMRVEVATRGDASARVVELPGRELAVRAVVFVVPPQLVFLGATAGARLAAISAAEAEQVIWEYVPPHDGLLELLKRIPGVALRQTSSAPARTNILRVYRAVLIDADTLELRQVELQ